MRRVNPARVKKILLITLSNLGDVVLTFPVLDILLRDFPQAEISVVLGPKTKGLLIDHPRIKNIYIYHKHDSWGQKFRWALELRKVGFDFVVDLRHGVLPLLIGARYMTPLIRRRGEGHMKEKHLACLLQIHPVQPAEDCGALFISDGDRAQVRQYLAGIITAQDRYLVIAPGAADHRKRWTEEGFAEVADWVVQQYGLKVVFVGLSEETVLIERIQARMRMTSLNLAGRLSLIQVACLLQQASLAVMNDSGLMHLSSYLDVPTVAVFGPTDPARVFPWASRAAFVRCHEACAACTAGDRTSFEHTCMAAASGAIVKQRVDEILQGTMKGRDAGQRG